MFKFSLNALHIDFTLRPQSGFLVKADTKGLGHIHPELPDMCALRTHDAQGRETVFIPGSSLKGVFRSAGERVLRSLVEDQKLAARWAACDPLDRDEKRNPCQRDPFKKAPPVDTARVHAQLCLACRTFGSLALASRTRFADALPTDRTRQAANRTEDRAGVALDRRTGAVAHGPFDFEVITSGRFATSIDVENAQLWQVALLALVMDDIDLGLVRIGSARTRGLGMFQVRVERVVWRQVLEAPIRGVALLAPGQAGAYGLVGGDLLAEVPGQVKAARKGHWHTWTWTGHEAGSAFLRACMEAPWASLVRWLDGRARRQA